jgi:hypothetical protein
MKLLSAMLNLKITYLSDVVVASSARLMIPGYAANICFLAHFPYFQTSSGKNYSLTFP